MHFYSSNMYNRCWCLLCVLVILLTLISSTDSRPPQLIRPPLPFDNKYNNSTIKRQNSTASQRNVSVQTRILSSGHSNKGSGFFGEYSEQDIVFPDEIEFEPIPRIDETPKCADDSTFCEDFASYPYYHVQDILAEVQTHRDLYGKDEVPKELVNRIGEDEENAFCGAVERTIYPKVAKNKNSKWKYVVNQGDDFIQGVRIETCQNHGGPCELLDNLPNGYKAFCKQKYIYRRMLSLNDRGAPTPDTFQLPSGCCCFYKRDMQFLTKFRQNFTPAKSET